MSGSSKFQIRRRLLKAFPEAGSSRPDVSSWFDTALGQKVLEAERALVDPILSRLFGYHILQIGCSDQHSLIAESPVGHKIQFSSAVGPQVQQAVARNEELPLSEDSMDVVLIHHALDFSADSHKLLREAVRVLRPGGKLILLGFNPVSAWGVRKLFGRSEAPWSGRFITTSRASDWLKLLDLFVESTTFGCHFLPVRYARLLSYADGWERLGVRMNSHLGGIYFILGIKQVATITPILPRWRPLRAPAKVLPATENVRARIH